MMADLMKKYEEQEADAGRLCFYFLWVAAGEWACAGEWELLSSRSGAPAPAQATSSSSTSHVHATAMPRMLASS
jgi:hypothetical protein